MWVESPRLHRTPTNKKEKNQSILKLGTRNIRTMATGLLDIQNFEDARKTAVINNEQTRLNMDIVALQETHLSDAGMLKEKDFTFIWQGNAAGERREHGVGFAIRNALFKETTIGEHCTERLLTLNISTESGPLSIINVYAPTLIHPQECTEEFYAQLSHTISDIPNGEQIVLLGDSNARVGADFTSWPTCLGRFGVGNCNENGQILLELCSYHDLCVSNTFSSKPSPSTRCLGDTHVRSTGISWI